MNVYHLQPEREGFRWLTMAQEPDLGLLAVLRAAGRRAVDHAGRGHAGAGPGGPHPAPSRLSRLHHLGRVQPAGGGRCCWTCSSRTARSCLECDEGDFFVYNVTRVLDALDEAASELRRFGRDRRGRVKTIVRHAFVPELVTASIFRIPQKPLRIYVTERFVDRVVAAELTGFSFSHVWPDLLPEEDDGER